MAAVRGSIGCDVLRVVGVVVLCSVFVLMLTVTVRGQTTQSGGAIDFSPGVTQSRESNIMMSILPVFICEMGTFSPGGYSCRHLRLEGLQGGAFGFCRSWQSLSLMLIVSSGASRHTKIQLGDKSIQALKIQHFISARLLRKLSANIFPHSFPLAAEAEDDFNSGCCSNPRFSTAVLF